MLLLNDARYTFLYISLYKHIHSEPFFQEVLVLAVLFLLGDELLQLFQLISALVTKYSVVLKCAGHQSYNINKKWGQKLKNPPKI